MNQGKILCIQKGVGPYQNRWHLPGGSQKIGESLIQTLKREVTEETGYEVEKYYNNRMFDAFVRVGRETTPHIFALYDIMLSDMKGNVEKFLDGEENDSKGVGWVASQNFVWGMFRL